MKNQLKTSFETFCRRLVKKMKIRKKGEVEEVEEVEEKLLLQLKVKENFISHSINLLLSYLGFLNFFFFFIMYK